MKTRILLVHGHYMDCNLEIDEVEKRLLTPDVETGSVKFGSVQNCIANDCVSNTEGRFNPKNVVALIAI